jgi:hypothetical protein
MPTSAFGTFLPLCRCNITAVIGGIGDMSAMVRKAEFDPTAT